MAMCRSGSRPRMLICYLCGREYGSRSLPVHIPQCQKKWVLEEDRKPRNERRPLPLQPNAAPTRGGGAQAFDNFNAEAFAAFEQTLEQCPHCQRRFEEKAYERHQKGCTAARPAKPAGTGLIRFSLTNRLVPGAVSGSMHGKAKTQPLPLCYLRPPPKPVRSRLKSTARPAWSNGDGPSGDDNFVPMILRAKPSKQEWCLQSETSYSSPPPSHKGSHHRKTSVPDSRNDSFDGSHQRRTRVPDSRSNSFDGSHPRRTRVPDLKNDFCDGSHQRKTRVSDSRYNSFDGNSLRHCGGGDNSHLVSTFEELWRTHKDSENVRAPRMSSIHAREEDLMPLPWITSNPRVASNPQMVKYQCFSTTSQAVNRQPPISTRLKSSQVGHRKIVH